MKQVDSTDRLSGLCHGCEYICTQYTLAPLSPHFLFLEIKIISAVDPYSSIVSPTSKQVSSFR